MAQTKQGVKNTKQKHGKDCYREWGKRGGNPILMKQQPVNVK